MVKKEISIRYTFFQSAKMKWYTGADMLHSTRRGSNSYILLHKNSLHNKEDKLAIITNNRHIMKKYDKPFMVLSDQVIINKKFIVSKYLTSVFCGLPINIDTRNKYFSRIRQLLLDKLVAIKHRLKKEDKNKQTTTYIKFSHRKRTWYLSFYIPCSFCKNACAYVMSHDRKVCQNCHEKIIEIPKSIPIKKDKKYISSKRIISKRNGTSYIKEVSLLRNGNYTVKFSDLQLRSDYKLQKIRDKFKKRFSEV